MFWLHEEIPRGFGRGMGRIPRIFVEWSPAPSVLCVANGYDFIVPDR